MVCRRTCRRLGILCAAWALTAAVGLLWHVGNPQSVEAADPVVRQGTDAGTAMNLLFDPGSAAQLRSRGVLRRTNFVDLLGTTQSRLQIAFVIDGTDSMGRDIEGVAKAIQNMTTDIRGQKESLADPSSLTFSLVVFRDADSPSGPVSYPLGESFTSDAKKLEDALASVNTESGVPAFQEAIDLGVYEAIDALDWRQDGDTSRWILVFGDAPPHSEKRATGEVNERRYHTTQALVDAAKELDVVISCILCSSGFAAEGDPDPVLAKTYEEALPMTREFMSEISTKTGGILLDLSDQGLREQLAQAAVQRQSQAPLRIGDITPEDVVDARSYANSQDWNAAVENRTRVAVLPHTPLASMKFADGDEPVLVATELRQKLNLMPRIEVRNPTEVRAAFERLAAEELSDGALLHKLAVELGVDYVIWGRVDRDPESVRLTSTIYKKVDGEALAEATEVAKAGESTRAGSAIGETSLVYIVAERLMRNATAALKDAGGDERSIEAFAQVITEADVAKEMAVPVSTNIRARRELLAGLEALECSLAYDRDEDEAAAEHLQQATLKLKAAALLDGDNPLVQALLASAYYNQAELDQSGANIKLCYEAIERAHQLRDKALHQCIRQEVEADYALLVAKDYQLAIDKYTELAHGESGATLNSSLRAHWMLVGIYSGDWNVPQEFVDPTKARNHIIQILANWEDSPEARYYKKVLEWNEETGTQKPFSPKRSDAEAWELAGK